MHLQGSSWSAAVASSDGNGGRNTPLRVDAQRNLEHVLRAAREVFGELGYGAPMEDVARRARVGVGTVYRRFPSKDVLVRRIAEEETARLTDQARAALGQENEPWSALARFLRTSVASGAGRLLPPQVLRVGVDVEAEIRLPQQRQAALAAPGQPELRLVERPTAPEDEPDDAGAAALLEVVGQ
ncbi:helix-turn-helix domain-containing protein, partial [Streptomyces antimycoticus]